MPFEQTAGGIAQVAGGTARVEPAAAQRRVVRITWNHLPTGTNRVQARDQIVQVGGIEQRILLIRGERVIIDADLAEVYGVTTKRLNEQVKRNSGRFPGDFVFALSVEEKREVVANCDHLRKLKYSRSLPYAFTEHGAIMAASVLNSQRAIEMSVFVVRAFVRLRRYLVEHRELARRLEDLERAIGAHDRQIVAIVEAIRRLMGHEEIPPQRRIGFEVGES